MKKIMFLLAIAVAFNFNTELFAQTNSNKKKTAVKKIDPTIEQGKILISKSDCMSCHKPKIKHIGPSFQDIASKYPPTSENYTLLVQNVIKGGRGNWGPVAMSPHATLPPEDVKKMIAYILSFK